MTPTAPKLYFVFFIILVQTQLACDFCSRVQCEGKSGNIELHLMNNGKNALFGPDAFIHKDSVRIADFFTVTRPVSYSTRETFFLNLKEGFRAIVDIGSIRKDTFEITMRLVSIGECCKGYDVTSVLINGDVICSEFCEDVVLDIEI